MTNRVVNVRANASLLSTTLSGHALSEVTSDWPEDAVITFAWWDQDRTQVVFQVHSSTFDEIPEGALIPDWTPTYKLVLDETQMLYEIVTKMGEST